MNSKKAALLAAGLMLLLSVVLLVQPTVAQGGQNLLVNAGFEEGHYNQDGIAEITVPNGWRMYWVDGTTFYDAYDGLPAHRPETVVWNAQGGVPAGEEVFWRDGIYTLKIFKSWAPMYAGLSQDVSGLEVGRRYQLVAPVYTDVYDWEGSKVPPADPTHGQVRLGASPLGAGWRDEATIGYSGWFASSYASYGNFVHEFTATQPDMTVWIEVKALYPHGNNGFFIDTVGLYALEEFGSVANPGSGAPPVAAVPAGPTSTPLPPPTPRADGAIIHRVSSGDTFWVIAVQYAPAMGLSPEEALPANQELNNNPQFLSVGQELLIVPPQETGTAPVTEEGTPEPEAELREAAATDAGDDAETTETEEAATDETTETAAETAVLASPAGGGSDGAEPAPVAAGDGSGICVSVFSDDNGDGQRGQGTESLLTDAAVTVARGGNTISTYVSDGISDSHCFQNLEADTYTVQFFPPADYETTTDDSWAVVVSSDVMVPVSFGAQFNPGNPAEVADATAGDVAPGSTTEADAGSEATNALVAELPEEGGFPIGTIIIGVAVFLVVLAAIGVALLRRA